MKRLMFVALCAVMAGCATVPEYEREGIWDARYEQAVQSCRRARGVTVQVVDRASELHTAKRERGQGYYCRRGH